MKRGLVILVLLAALGLFWGAGRLNRPLREERARQHLNPSDPVGDAPPLLTFTTVALGGFRGILADLLWLRAARLQEEGQYFELVQLATWVTRLEPRFPQAWAFHAWNMAYNISVLFAEPANRWRWVRHGITLLRDEGLKYNPGEARLYRELGWLFQHKIGAAMDQTHLFYKEAWAREMAALFDGPAPDYERLRPEVRRRMANEYRLDPDLMRKVEEQFGPLDWRLPQAHAVYWAWRGRPFAAGFELQACNRMIYQSLRDAFLQGRLAYDTDEGLLLMLPNLDVLPGLLRTLEEFIAMPAWSAEMRDIRRSILGDAALMYYTLNREEEARRYFEEWKAGVPSEETPPDFESFVFKNYVGEIEGSAPPDYGVLIEQTLYQSLYWQALGYADRAAGYERLAALCRDRAGSGFPPLDEFRRSVRQRLLGELRSEQARARIRDEAAW
ncbi:MAG TPA: hypothetical protein P5567_08095 [Kiritimatiellia bacterium]|nr:hypothetical protein [Kiritimatiellia bacterium]HRZ12401.1 hypothetical protein [Kiritimatiellia bacterium]HSA17841.1 hypothetical protein [Kiritimatiellia bacterium]